MEGMPNHIPLKNAGSNQIDEWFEQDMTQSNKEQQSHHIDCVELVEGDCFSMVFVVV